MEANSTHLHDNGADLVQEGPRQAREASFIVVEYGRDRHTLVNADCSILHLLMHLRAKYIGDGFKLDPGIRVEGCRRWFGEETPNRKHLSSVVKRSGIGSEADDDSLEYRYLDLLDSSATPLDLSNHAPLTNAKPLLTHRSEYILCTTRKNRVGVIREAVPLVDAPSLDLRRRIDTVLRTIERFKRQSSGSAGIKTKLDDIPRKGAGKSSSSHQKRTAKAERRIREAT